MAHHEPQGGLTWYQGSIPPYASLWHTLVRLGTLNCLSLSQLPESAAGGNLKPTRPITWDPLFNEAKSIDTVALAAALRESASSLYLSHLGGLTPCVRSLFCKHLRFCRSCLLQGYHSSLFSLKLLPACPIHGEPFEDHCPCGKVIGNKLSSADFQQFCHCASLSPSCIGPVNCRTPQISFELPRSLDDIAKWIVSLSMLIKPMDRPGTSHFVVANPVRLDAGQWSDVFGIPYPALLSHPLAPGRHSMDIVKGGPFKMATHAALNVAPKRKNPYWRVDSPATWTYRAISRHLRRHCTGHDAILGGVLALPKDGTVVSSRLALNPSLAAAFCEARWAMCLERNVRERRWPYRSPATGSQQQFVGHLKLFDAPDWRVLDRNVGTWLEYHWAAYCMLSAWTYYKARTNPASAFDETPTPATEFAPAPWDWAAKTQADGSVLFAHHSLDSHILPTRLHVPKHDRIEHRQLLLQQRDRDFESACHGPCLTWSKLEDWHVSASVAPLTLRYSRNRLWGPFKEHPKFWLYPVANGFVARLQSVALQVQEKTPRTTIALLRCAFAQYIRIYPTASN